MTSLPSVRHSMSRGASFAGRAAPASLTDEELAATVMSPLARCSGAATDPDEWFPVAAVVPAARAEAQRALALCAACPVRAECLEMSLRQWQTIGKHGIWGGLVEAERAMAHREWLAGAQVTALLGAPVSEPAESPGPIPAGPAEAGEAGRVTSLGGARRKPGRAAGGCPPGTRTRRRSPPGAGTRPPSLVEQQ
jgi:WhiB family transcriptional regulator, redox-sensing transcriptional regulator